MLIEILSVLTIGIIGMIMVVGYNQTKLDLSFDLGETKPITSKTTLTTAIRGALAHLEQGTVNDVYFGVGSFGIEASKTKIRRQLRALRNTGKVALNFNEGRGSFKLAA